MMTSWHVIFLTAAQAACAASWIRLCRVRIVSEQPMFWRKVSSGTNLDYQKCEMNLGQTKVCTIRQEYLLYVHDAQLSQVCFDYEQSTIDQKQSQCS